MNAKQYESVNEFFTQIPEEYSHFFKEVTRYAAELGYTPKRNKTQSLSIDFQKSKIKKTIIKIEPIDLGRGISDKPGIRLKFYAASEYSEIFKDAIRLAIEEFDGKYTGCYGCGRCDSTHGYTYIYPNGKKVFRCGRELLSVYNYSNNYIDEFKMLMKIQDAFWIA